MSEPFPWPWTDLGSALVFHGSGATPRGGKDAYQEAGLPLVRSMNVYDLRFDRDDLAFIDEQQAAELQRVTIEPDDVLLNITGASVARCCLAPLEVVGGRVNQHVMILRLDRSVAEPGFVARALAGPYKSKLLSIAGSGATREALTKSDVETFALSLPPIHEQRAIARTLDAYAELIENNRRRIEILEEMAGLTYREWFVHFRFPGHADVEVVDSDLGPIPEGWDVTSLAEHVELQRRNVEPAAFPNEEFDHYSIPAFDADRLPVVEPGSRIKSGKFLLDANCVLLSKLNPRFARVWRASPGRSARRSICSTEFLVLEATGDWPDPFVFSLVSDADFGARLASMAGGTSTSHQRAKPKDVMALPVAGPPRELVARFSDQVRPMLNLADKLVMQNDLLSKARDLLLPRLVSGELDVSDLNLDLEPVA